MALFIANPENTVIVATLYIWGADLADMQLISKFNKGFRFIVNMHG